MTKAKSSRFIIISLFTIFIVPFILAWLAFSYGFFLSHHTVNNGKLLESPPNIQLLKLSSSQGQTLSKQQLLGKWWMLNVCPQFNDDCKKNLYYMRQIRQATGKNRERVLRGIIVFAQDRNPFIFKNQIHLQYPGTIELITSKNLFEQVLINQPFKKLALSQCSLYLVDPHGNIIMFYSKNIAPKKILKDLERLLRVSQIG